MPKTAQCSPKNSALLHDLIPVYAEKHSTFQQIRDYLAGQNLTDNRISIDQDNGLVSLTRSLYLLACFTRGEHEDYEEVASCQDNNYDHLTFETFKRLCGYFELFEVKPELYNLMELYLIIVQLSSTEIVNQYIPLIPKDKLNYGKFGMAYSLVDNELIPELSKLSLAEFDILRSALKYAARAEEIFATGKKITFNKEFSDSEQRIVYTSIVCDLAAFIGPIEVSGSLTLTESLASDLLLMLYHHNDPTYIGYLCSLSQ